MKTAGKTICILLSGLGLLMLAHLFTYDLLDYHVFEYKGIFNLSLAERQPRLLNGALLFAIGYIGFLLSEILDELSILAGRR